jgi:hypothetical protein
MFQFVLPCFSMLQQVMLPTRSDSRAHTRCLPLSCGPAPTVGRARNERSLPNARALHGQSACAHIECHSRPTPNQYITRRPAPPGMAPMVQHAAGSTHVYTRYAPSFSHAAGRAPRTCSPVGRSNSKRRRVFQKKQEEARGALGAATHG